MNERNREFYESGAGKAYNMLKHDGNPYIASELIRELDELDKSRSFENMEMQEK